MEKLRNKIKRGFVVFTFGAMGFTLASCGGTKDNTESTTAVATEAPTTENPTTENPTTEVPTTETPTTEAVTEATTEAPVLTDELDINNNASIERAVDVSYSKYEEFYKNNGISKDQIRDVIFVANDKYTDEDGKLIIDEERAIDAYMIINKILVSPSINMKINNIILANYEGTQEYGNFLIEKHPTLVDFIDRKIPGAESVINEVTEYEKLRDHEIEVINKDNMYDFDAIEKYIIKNEKTDIKNNENSVSNVNRNGQKYILASIHNSALNIAGMTCEETYIDGDIKVNPTNGERDLESEVITLMEQGLIDQETYDNVIIKVKAYASYKDEDEIVDLISREYEDIKIADTNLIVRYGLFLQTMQNDAYQTIMCDEQKETQTDIQVKRNKTTSNTKKILSI